MLNWCRVALVAWADSIRRPDGVRKVDLPEGVTDKANGAFMS